jgi:phytoene dehydrogenase-like protein
LEKRHIVGGAAVTEEIIPGFQFSRASYVFSLFRPQIIKDLDLHRHGLLGVLGAALVHCCLLHSLSCLLYVVYPRDPSSFTPTLDGRSLILGRDMAENQRSIGEGQNDPVH